MVILTIWRCKEKFVLKILPPAIHLVPWGRRKSLGALRRDVYCAGFFSASARLLFFAAFVFAVASLAATLTSCTPVFVALATWCATVFASTPTFPAPSLTAASTTLASRLAAAAAILTFPEMFASTDMGGSSVAYAADAIAVARARKRLRGYRFFG